MSNQGADTKANTVGGSGALERGYRAPLESFSEGGSSFGTEVVALQTASAGKEAGAEKCQWALTENQTLRAGGALERGHGAPLERLAQLGDALSSVGAGPPGGNAAELVVGQAAKGRRSVNGR